MKKTALAIVVVLGLAALGVAAQIYLVPTDGTRADEAGPQIPP